MPVSLTVIHTLMSDFREQFNAQWMAAERERIARERRAAKRALRRTR